MTRQQRFLRWTLYWALGLFGLLLVGIGVLDLMLPRWIDMEALKAKIEAGIYQGTGIRATTRTISVHPTLFHGVKVVLQNNVLRDPEAVEVIKAGRITVYVRYLPLLKRITSISKLSFNDIEVYIGERSYLFRLKRPKVPSKEVVVEDARIELTNYNLIVDRYFDRTNLYYLQGDTLALNHVKSTRPLELQGQGTFYFGPKVANQRLGQLKLFTRASQALLDKPRLDWEDVTQLGITLDDVRLETLAAIHRANGIPLYAAGEVGKLAIDIRGKGKGPKQLRINGLTSTPTLIQFAEYDFAFDPGRLMANLQVRWHPEDQSLHLDNTRIQLSSRQFHALLFGRLHLAPATKTSTLAMTMRTGWLPIRALELLPPLRPQQQQLLRMLRGSFATDLDVSGPLQKPQIQGTVLFDRLDILPSQGSHLLAQGLEGIIRIKSPHELALLGVRGVLGDGNVAMNMRINTQKQSIQGHINAQQVSLAALHQLARQLSFQNAPWQNLRPTGQLSANLKINHQWHSPRLDGTLRLDNLRLSEYPAHRQLLTQGQANLTFKGYRIIIDRLAARIGQASVLANGTMNRQTDDLNLKTRISKLNLSLAEKLLSTYLPSDTHWWRQLPLRQWGGILSSQLTITGTTRQPRLYGSARLTGGRARLVRGNTPLSNINGLLLFQNDTVASRALRLDLGKTPITLSGKLYQRFQRLALSVNAPQLDLASVITTLQPWAPTLGKTITLRGSASANLTLTGPIKQPEVTGQLALKGVSGRHLRNQLDFSGITGVISLTPTEYRIATLRGLIAGVPLMAQGTLAKSLKHYRLAVQASGVPLATLQDLLARIAPQAAAQLAQAGLQTGRADLDLVLSPSYPLGLTGTVALKNVAAYPVALSGVPINLAALRYNIGTGQLQVPANSLNIGGLVFALHGRIQPGSYQIAAASQKIPVSFFRDQKALIQRLAPGVVLPTLFNTAGDVQLALKLSPQQRDVTLTLFNAGASMKELKYPVYAANGVLHLTLGKTFKAYAENLRLRYGNSPLVASFDMRGLQDMYVETTGTLSPLLLNDLLLSNPSGTVAYAAVPFDINLSGKLGRLSGRGEGNNLNMFFNFNIASLLNRPGLEKPEEAGDVSLNQATLSSVLQLEGDTLRVEKTEFQTGEDNRLLVEGVVDNLFDATERQVDLIVKTEPTLDLAALARQVGEVLEDGLSGQIGVNLHLLGQAGTLGTQGTITFNNVHSPHLEVEDLTGQIGLTGNKANLNIAHFQIPGVDAAFTAQIANLFQYPLPVDNFHLTGSQFIVSLYSEWISNVIVDKVRKGFWEQFFPSNGRTGNMPFEIRSGTVRLAEGILNNLIVENYSSLIRVYPNAYFELDGVQAQSAGGSVSGHFAMSPRDNNFMVVHLLIDKMKANAVSRILLNVTNQIFGDLSGTIDYTTEGHTPEEMLANTNGYADLRIEQGRLPAIARIENLLVAANTISGGLANLNLNSLFRLAAPFNTDYFAKLTGTFKMVDGIIHTDDMHSDGQNLDLDIKGVIRMVDGFANLNIRGEMDREIGGVLGPIGKLSFGRFLSLVPPLRQLISHIPGIGFIPGFGGPRAENGVAFTVNIVGPVTDPGSVQDFQWTH